VFMDMTNGYCIEEVSLAVPSCVNYVFVVDLIHLFRLHCLSLDHSKVFYCFRTMCPT
jgi:hypothetical protein